MITIRNLVKRFGQLVAVNNISLEIAEGEIFGFLGPNGAGKTTTIKILTGLIKPTSGSATICSYDIVDMSLHAKRLIGYIPEQPVLYNKLTVEEFLVFVCKVFKVNKEIYHKRINELLELFSLQNYQHQLVENLSHGMRQKVILSAALIHNPRVIIVDEPTVGLDPKSIRLVKNLFREEQKEKKTTIFMSTHILQTAEEMCDRIGIIDKGNLIALGRMEELRERAGQTSGHLEELFFKLTEEAETPA